MRRSPQSAKKDLMSFSFPALYACTSRYCITDTCTVLLFSISAAFVSCEQGLHALQMERMPFEETCWRADNMPHPKFSDCGLI